MPKSRRHSLKKTKSTNRGGTKRTRTRTRNYKRKSMKKRGGCGCGMNNPFQFGGDTVASFNSDLPPTSYYPQNPLLNDSTDPGILVNARNLPNMASSNSMGGKRKYKNGKKRVRISRKIGQIKGGMGFSDFLVGSNPENSFLSSATSSGVMDSYNTYNMRTDTNPAAYVQPAMFLYNDANPPLA